jgi:nicotinamidase-related amidase
LKTALLVVDMQKGFTEESSGSFSEIIGFVNYSINTFHKANQPIVFIQDEDAGEGPGSEGFELYEDLLEVEDAIFVSKKYSNSFWQTDLEEILQELNVEMVFICGFAAEACVQATYLGAQERGFDASLIQHGIASSDRRYIGFIQEIYKTTAIKVVDNFLNK